MESALKKHAKTGNKILEWVLMMMILSSPETAESTVVLRADFPELFEKSDWVVEARVVRVNPKAVHPLGGVETRVTIEVSRWWKGQFSDRSLIIRLPGGQRDGVKTKVAGIPQFKEGEDLILFLEQYGNGGIPTGLYQGVFRVVSGDGELLVTQSLGSVHYVERGEKGALNDSPHQQDTYGIPLEQFRNELRLRAKDAVRPYHRIEEAGPTVLQ